MIPVKDFPYAYGETQTDSNPVHKKLLLMRLSPNVGHQFVIGFYDAVHDVFQVWCSPFVQTEDNLDRYPAGDRYYSDHYSILPRQYQIAKGPNALTEFMPMDEVLMDMEDRNLFDENIRQILSENSYGRPYLIITKDKCVTVTTTTRYAVYGNGFSGIEPAGTKDIEFAANLMMWYEKRWCETQDKAWHETQKRAKAWRESLERAGAGQDKNE